MISYPEESKQLYSLFTQYRNSVNIYTEDEEKDTKFYKLLFKRLLDGTGITVSDITPLGSCRDVIEACHKDTSSFPKLYIVDGDIDLMVNPKSTADHLFVLDRYCIENYVIDENSLYRALDEMDYIHDINIIKELIKYDELVNSIVDSMLDIFRHFAVAKKLIGCFRIKTVSCVLDKNCVICHEKLEVEKSFVKDYCQQINGVKEEDFISELNVMESLFPNTIDNLFKYVSAKNYLLPYIISVCRNKLDLSIGIPRDNWKYQLAKYCNVENLSDLRERIINEVPHQQS